jgi:hypothetical protein
MHQWYWSYQYPDFLNSDEELIDFDSYLVPEVEIETTLLSSNNDGVVNNILPGINEVIPGHINNRDSLIEKLRGMDKSKHIYPQAVDITRSEQSILDQCVRRSDARTYNFFIVNGETFIKSNATGTCPRPTGHFINWVIRWS